MSAPISDLRILLETLQPVLHDGVFVFCRVSDDLDLGALQPVGLFRETEGTTLILEEKAAQARGLAPLFRAAWITLTVHSELQAVGLTAAVARALADEGISCNVVAAVHHDHLFVPVAQAAAALDALRRLQQSSIN